MRAIAGEDRDEEGDHAVTKVLVDEAARLAGHPATAYPVAAGDRRLEGRLARRAHRRWRSGEQSGLWPRVIRAWTSLPVS